jgi:bifunctional non-homologous end joining protein LigD
MAFDILTDHGMDVRSEPIEKRKARLAARVSSTNHLRPVLPIAGNGEWLYAQAEAVGLEGIVAKRKGTPYPAGRSANWLKIKTEHGRAEEARRSANERR